MVSIIKRKGNTSTGFHMVQVYGDNYKFRCCPASIQRLVSVPVKPQHMHYFTSKKDGVYHSELFDNAEECADALIMFIFSVTGIECTRDN